VVLSLRYYPEGVGKREGHFFDGEVVLSLRYYPEGVGKRNPHPVGHFQDPHHSSPSVYRKHVRHIVPLPF